jgi:hypothetical protein
MEAAAIPACGAGILTPANTTPCVPDGLTPTDAYYWVEGTLVDQAGNEVDTPILVKVLQDQTLPTTNNTQVPTSALVGGVSTDFGFTVQDNLDLWSTQMAFDFEAVADSETGVGFGLFIPFGQPLEVGDGDRWDTNVVNTFTGTYTVPFVQSLELTTAGNAPTGAGTAVETTNIRAVTVDAAGNNSAPFFNNFLPSTITTPATITYAVAGNPMTGLTVTTPAAATNLCNGQGAIACPETAAGVSSVTLTVTATGTSGIYPNPFANGNVYFYVVTDPVAPAPYYNATNVFALLQGVPGTGATFTDTGAVRTYSWTYTLTKDQVATIAAGTNISIAVIGVNATGDAILSQYNANITVVAGT